MKNKSKESYLIAFNYLKSVILYIPEFIVIDFEMTAFSALIESFIGCKIRGCFFHFSQILYSKIQKLGLTTNYMKSSDFRECFEMILALAAVPIDKLEIEIEKLKIYINKKENLDDMKGFFNDFVNLYSRTFSIESNPENIFSVYFWSIHDRLLKQIPKTINAL
ncbi:hypothetical protein DMUE_3245, partial [Dictyocoela muelleri]